MLICDKNLLDNAINARQDIEMLLALLHCTIYLLLCSHVEQKCEKYQNVLSENSQFLMMKISIYLNRRVLVMVLVYFSYEGPQ